MTSWLGVDFGTSNSAAAYLADGEVVHVALEDGRSTIPTSLFFDPYDRKTLFGNEANEALLDGVEGRYMRALKSVLGSPMMKEVRVLAGRRTDFFEVVSHFLRRVKDRSEAQAGRPFTHAVAGRPVFFHSSDPARNAQAEKDLEACYLKAGFEAVRFMYEPEAAALASEHGVEEDGTGLVVDIGGGTSDFTLFKRTSKGLHVIASNGVRVGGTDFDRQISFDRFMPLLGRGHELKRRFATGTVMAPIRIYSELASWEKIPFLYDNATLEQAKSLKQDALEPHVFARLVRVLQMRLGHDLAFEAEKTKIAYNSGSNDPSVDLSLIEPDLTVSFSRDAFDESLSPYGDRLLETIQATLEQGKLAASEVDKIILVGGSSSMNVVLDAVRACLPDARMQTGDIFTSIVDGLAMASGDQT